MFGHSDQEDVYDTSSAVGNDQSFSPHASVLQRLARMCGLDVRAAVLAVFVDLTVFAGDTFSVETLVPLGIAVAAGLGYIVYKIQRKYQDDDHDSALIKALTVGILTAIPIPLTPLLAIPGGIVNLLNGRRI